MRSPYGVVTLSTPSLFFGESMRYEESIDFDNLYRAMRKCRNGVAWKDSVARYTADGLKETYRLRQELLTGTYHIRPYHNFIVTDPKRREVMATQIRDRQFQRALCDSYLYEQITKGFIRDNYACQRGRGLDDAFNRMDAHLHRYYREHGSNEGWVLKCDIHHYFAETSHDVAKRAVRKRVPDDGVYNAVAQIIDSFGGDKGIGLGSQVSQLIQLAVLDDMDHFIKERLHIKHYLRYMDDFILIHDDKDYLQYCLSEIKKHLSALGLALNKKTAIFPIKQGITWLKWRFILTDTGKVIRRLPRKSYYHERRKLTSMKPMVDAGKLPLSTPFDSLQSWIGGAKRGDTKAEIRCMILFFEGLYGVKYTTLLPEHQYHPEDDPYSDYECIPDG